MRRPPSPSGLPDARAWGDSETDFKRLLPQASGPWLAVSGGGSDGAFGGGVLAGWSQAGNRPEFAVVTGASIGALIAPFAFLGSAYDEELRKNFTTITAADVFEDRATRDSLFDDWPLKRLIEQRVTAKLMADIAAEHRRGRRLLVATTNLDAGRRVVWNMGAIAERGDDKALKLFRDVLLASCSIPGFFSPVAIDVEANGKQFQEMHGDGTITAPFFVVPESMLSATSKSRPPISQLYVIVNSKLSSEFKMPDRSVVGVLGRSIDVALTSALRAEIALMSVGAQRYGIGLRVAHLDPAFNHPSRGPFDGKYMQRAVRIRGRARQEGHRLRGHAARAVVARIERPALKRRRAAADNGRDGRSCTQAGRSRSPRHCNATAEAGGQCPLERRPTVTILRATPPWNGRGASRTSARMPRPVARQGQPVRAPPALTRSTLWRRCPASRRAGCPAR